ncbi:MAG: hypothetical protein A49_11640 [Methyloceanibacter sp.]|nr:MAG: hypothetical protein A49_11640 [Methyloceanibacter sp.]
MVVLGLYYAIRPWTGRKALLLVASYAFYAAWNPPFVALLWVSTIVDWYAARALHRATEKPKRVAFAIVSLVVNLGLLGFFKYGGFFVENVSSMVGFYGVSFQAARPDIVLPWASPSTRSRPSPTRWTSIFGGVVRRSPSSTMRST